jgi:hypothetical protein
MTSQARLPSLTMRANACRASSRSGANRASSWWVYSVAILSKWVSARGHDTMDKPADARPTACSACRGADSQVLGAKLNFSELRRSRPAPHLSRVEEQVTKDSILRQLWRDHIGRPPDPS